MTTVYYGLFLALGLVVSFEDWAHRKIRNRLIVLGLLACVLGLGWLLANSILGHRHVRFMGLGEYYLPWSYYPKILAHLLLALFAAFAFWIMAVWPAGDAKFFVVCAFFVALIDPNLPGFPTLLFLLLLINIFVPAGVIFAAETAVLAAMRLSALRGGPWRMRLKAQADTAAKRLLDAWPHRRGYMILALNLFALFYAMQAAQARLRPAASGPWATMGVFALMAVSWRFLAKLLRRRAVGLLALSAAAAWTSIGFLRLGWNVAERLHAAAAMTFHFGLFLSLGRMLVYGFIERESLRDMRVEQLSPGVVLSDAAWESLRARKGVCERLEGRRIDGLSADDVDILKSLPEGPGGGSYVVYHTIPFAVWIFLGALLTLAGRRGIIDIFKAAMSRGSS